MNSSATTEPLPLTLPEFALAGDDGTFRSSLEVTEVEAGVHLIAVMIDADIAHRPPVYTLTWSHPAIDIHAWWHAGRGLDKGLLPDYARGFVANATALAPVVCLHSASGRNRATLAFSDALNTTLIRAGVNEETAHIACSVTLFSEPHEPINHYRATLRLDLRPVRYDEALADVGRWWSAMPEHKPAPVPDAARRPMYSTWYAFHQRVTADDVQQQCAPARALGCEAVILDDGWQNGDTDRGYASCGDWLPEPAKFADMSAHVARVHEAGLHHLLWYSVPFIGERTDAWSRFADKMLGYWPAGRAWVVDPRFPEVRDYIVGTYEAAVRTWGLDGIKLDFVDSFRSRDLIDSRYESLGGGRDIDSVPVAVDRLLSEVIARLVALRPAIMVEFRQSYIGPLMRKYGNIFRVADCGNDPLRNRVGVLDLRLLCGGSATHSDMLMWNVDESPENVALQLLNVIFAVPQISVRLDRLSGVHREVLRFWLEFWREQRDVLLDGALRPLHPEAHYPAVIASDERTTIVAAYNEILVDPGPAPTGELIALNGSPTPGVVLDLDATYDATGLTELSVLDCRGRLVAATTMRSVAGVRRLPVPVGGLARLQRVSSSAGAEHRPMAVRMLSALRQGLILDELGRGGAIHVARLRDQLRVSASTVGRDLLVLETQGHLKRVRGGAVDASRLASRGQAAVTSYDERRWELTSNE